MLKPCQVKHEGVLNNDGGTTDVPDIKGWGAEENTGAITEKVQ